MSEQRFLSEREAAAYLGISKVTLYKIRKNPGVRQPVPHSRVGVRVVYDREQLVEWVHAHQATEVPAKRRRKALEAAGDAD